MGINNEFTDTRVCTTIIAFYNGKSFPERSRNRKHRTGFNKVSMPKRGAMVKGLHVNEDTHFGPTVSAFASKSLRLKGLLKRERLQITEHFYLVQDFVNNRFIYRLIVHFHSPLFINIRRDIGILEKCELLPNAFITLFYKIYMHPK